MTPRTRPRWIATAQLNSPRSAHSGAPTISTGRSSRLASAMLPSASSTASVTARWCSRSSIAYAESPSSGNTTSAAWFSEARVASASVRSALKTGSAGRRWGTAAATRANPWL